MFHFLDAHSVPYWWIQTDPPRAKLFTQFGFAASMHQLESANQTVSTNNS